MLIRCHDDAVSISTRQCLQRKYPHKYLDVVLAVSRSQTHAERVSMLSVFCTLFIGLRAFPICHTICPSASSLMLPVTVTASSGKVQALLYYSNESASNAC